MGSTISHWGILAAGGLLEAGGKPLGKPQQATLDQLRPALVMCLVQIQIDFCRWIRPRRGHRMYEYECLALCDGWMGQEFPHPKLVATGCFLLQNI